jgi:hypothetical protein
MAFLIDKRTAREWIVGFHARNEHRVNSHPESKMVEVTQLAEEMAYTFFRCLSEHAPDETARTQMIEAVARGLTSAILQTLLIATPPSFEKPTEAVN